MAHFNGNSYDNFSFDPNSIGVDWKSGNQPAMRRFGTRLSKRNINYVGPRMSTDYTRTTLGFAFQEGQNPEPELGAGYGTDPGDVIYNPFQWGVTAAHLRMLDDSLLVLNMEHGGRKLPDYGDAGADLTPPRKDVMDRKQTSAESMVQYTNYPKEGWASFGRKYDKQRAWAGNTWINGMV